MMPPTTAIERKPTLRFRHELKYTVTSREDAELSSRLSRLFAHDKHAGPDGSYRITSLYLDTPGDHALRQKIEGVDRREKFRIRYYGEDPTFLKLEKKMKISGLCAKQSARLTPDQARQILDGDIDFLLHSGQPLLTELYSKLRGQLLRPKTIVCYDREAFIYLPGNVRVTLDRNLRTSLRCTDFLDASRLHLGVSDQEAVLEVKYDDFLPEIVRMAVQTGSRQTAYSKYAVCRKYE